MRGAQPRAVELSLRHDLLVAAWRAGGRDHRHGALRSRGTGTWMPGSTAGGCSVPCCRDSLSLSWYRLSPPVSGRPGQSAPAAVRRVGRRHRRVSLRAAPPAAGSARRRHTATPCTPEAEQQSGRSRHPTRTSQAASRSPITQMRCSVFPHLPGRLARRPQRLQRRLVAQRVHRLPEAGVAVGAQLAVARQAFQRSGLPRRVVARRCGPGRRDAARRSRR